MPQMLELFLQAISTFGRQTYDLVANHEVPRFLLGLTI
jgi:hypothetical protein